MIERETIRSGFEKYHLDRTGSEGWPVRPVLHRITEPDPYYPHDHPFELRAYVLSGGYVEEVYEPTPDGLRLVGTQMRQPGDAFVIPAGRIHRIVEIHGGECWTCCVYGPHEQEPRFWRGEGSVEWRPLAWGGEWRAWQPEHERPAAEAVARE